MGQIIFQVNIFSFIENFLEVMFMFKLQVHFTKNDYSTSFLESPESENTDPLPGTYQQQVQLQPVVRPEKSGISAQFSSCQSHVSLMS